MKRITIKVNEDIDVIQDRIAKDTGIHMTYVQLVNFLVHFYMTKANEPKSQWAVMK